MVSRLHPEIEALTSWLSIRNIHRRGRTIRPSVVVVVLLRLHAVRGLRAVLRQLDSTDQNVRIPVPRKGQVIALGRTTTA